MVIETLYWDEFCMGVVSWRKFMISSSVDNAYLDKGPYLTLKIPSYGGRIKNISGRGTL